MNRISALQALLIESPNDSFILFALALEYQKNGDLEQSLTHFKTIRANDPTYTGVYYHLGKLYEKLGLKEAALSTYNEGIVLTRKTDPHACSELQQALQDLDLDD